jgi:hypothetical protein
VPNTGGTERHAARNKIRFAAFPLPDVRRRAGRRIDQVSAVTIETPQPTFQPGAAERAIDTATDVSRTITEMSAALGAAVDQLSEAIATARQPGKPLSTISAITREAPLASLFLAFLLGVAVARRR